jgi:hypothetical protein
MNIKASTPSTNPTKKCRALFPYFPSLEGGLAGEHTVVALCHTDEREFSYLKRILAELQWSRPT